MNESNEGESAPVENEENLEKTFETTAKTLFGSINDGSIDNSENKSNNDENCENNDNQTNNENVNNDENKDDCENLANVSNDENKDDNNDTQENEERHENSCYKNSEENNEIKKLTDDSKKDILLQTSDCIITKKENGTDNSTENSEMTKSESSNLSKRNKDELSLLAQQILDGKEDPSAVEFDETLPVLTYITRYRNDKMALHEVDEAERSDLLIATIIRNYKTTLIQINRQKKEDFIKSKLEKAEKKLQEAEKETKRSITELKAQNDQSLQNLKTIQNQEVDNLINKFNSPVLQRHFSQASSHLRTLRFQTQLLQQSKRFDELRIAQKCLADEEKREIENVSRTMTSQLKNQIKLLEEKHRCEIESRQIAFEDRETKMKRICTMKTDAIKNHISNINADLEMLKTKKTESSQNIMQNGELMLKITKATAAKKSRPQTSLQKKTEKKSIPFFQRESEQKKLSKSYNEADLFSLKLPPLTQSKGIKAKREMMLNEYKA